MAKYNIGGYIFNEEESAKKAAKELKTVEYILGQLKDSDEKAVLQIYNKLLKQRLFSTEIGLGFLSQLRQNLIASGVFAEDEVAEVYSIDSPVTQEKKEPEIKEEVSTEKSEQIKNKPKKEEISEPKAEKRAKKSKAEMPADSQLVKRLKIINSILIVISITLLLCVIGMFYITSTINSPTILNYEEAITNEYSTWKQELEAKEAELREREKALDELEESLEQ